MKNLIRKMIEMDYKYKSGHLASCLSALPIISQTYERMTSGDYFILSKGHAGFALYAVLEKYGYKPDWSKMHPDRDEKNGIYATTGSLGHGLPLAIGLALGLKLQGKSGNVYVLLGDGECLEGTTWESLIIGNYLQLNNICVCIDNNGFTALGKRVMPTVEILKKNFSLTVFNYQKGYGIKMYENNPAHVHQLTKEEYEQIMEEL